MHIDTNLHVYGKRYSQRDGLVIAEYPHLATFNTYKDAKLVADLVGSLAKLCDEWERQKELFPALKQDGWMELAVREARRLLEGQAAGSEAA